MRIDCNMTTVHTCYVPRPCAFLSSLCAANCRSSCHRTSVSDTAGLRTLRTPQARCCDRSQPLRHRSARSLAAGAYATPNSGSEPEHTENSTSGWRGHVLALRNWCASAWVDYPLWKKLAICSAAVLLCLGGVMLAATSPQISVPTTSVPGGLAASVTITPDEPSYCWKWLTYKMQKVRA
jgi:hypothetical protein